MAEYTLSYTGNEINSLLAKIEQQEQEIATLRDSISHLLWSGSVGTGDSISVTGLKNTTLVAVQFNLRDKCALMSTADGSHQAGDAWVEGYDLTCIYCNAMVSGEDISFGTVQYGKYTTAGLGNPLVFAAGDAIKVTKIYSV